MDPDPLSEVLKLARREGALEGEDLQAFVKGLRERAERIIAERLERGETKLRVLGTENEWQKGAMATLAASVRALEGEKAWLRETLGSLEGEKAWLRETIGNLEGEAARLKEAVGNLDAEATRRRGAMEEAGEEQRKASAAHELLLAHHLDLMARLAGQLGDVASLSPLRAQEVRRRLRSLADLLRADSR